MNHRDGRSGEAVTKVAHAIGMKLHRDHARASVKQVAGQRPVAGTDVENEISGSDTGILDNASRPLVSERMPAPCSARSPGGGHGGQRS